MIPSEILACVRDFYSNKCCGTKTGKECLQYLYDLNLPQLSDHSGGGGGGHLNVTCRRDAHFLGVSTTSLGKQKWHFDALLRNF